MIVRVIRIGNSRGIILSRTLLARYGIDENLEIEMKEEHMELKPVNLPRQGWGNAFKQMSEAGDDQLLDDDVLEDDEDSTI